MMQPKSYICYSPDKAGHVFASFHFESGADIYGWHIEGRGHCFSAGFFMIENFYAARATRFYRSIQDDVYGPWAVDYPPAGGEIRCPVPEPLGHELECAQSRFVEEWLFFRDDPHIGAELDAYESGGFAVQAVNIRRRRLNRLCEHSVARVHASQGTDPNVIDLLRKYWRLSEKLPVR